MEFRQLKYVLTVAEERSFSNAAKKLYIAQPSLSQFIAKLEHQLGVQLFDRTISPLRLTYAGELYIEMSKKILDLKSQLSNQMDDIAELKKGRITIGISPFRSTYTLPHILPLFHERFPGIEVILAEGTMDELEKFALRGTTDFSIMNLPIKENLFDYEPITTEEILIALPPRHPLSQSLRKKKDLQPQIALANLREDPFILLKPGQRLRQSAMDLCWQAGFKPHIALESKSIEAAYALVATGMGVTFVVDTLANQRPNGSLCCSIAGLKPTRSIVIAYRQGRYLSKASKEFIVVAKDIFAHKNHNI